MEFEKMLKKFMIEHPQYNNEQELEEAIKLYFTFIREEIESGKLNQIRMKYFGSFRPLLGKIGHLKKNINWDKLTNKEKERYVRLFENYDRITLDLQKESEEDL